MSVPTVEKVKPPRLPRTASAELANGLEVLAARRSGVPMVEYRLRVPGTAMTAAEASRRLLAAETLLLGTDEHDAAGIAAAARRLGGTIDAVADADALYLFGAVLARNLDSMLHLLGTVLSRAAFPAEAVAAEQVRLGHELLMQRSRPQTMAAEALRRRMFGAHPYGLGLPEPADVAALTPRMLRSFHRRRFGVEGAHLVLCGHVSTTAALDAAAALAPLTGATGIDAPAAPPLAPGPILVVDRPGSVQTNIRIGGTAPTRRDATYAAADLALMAFGGYSSSRLVANIREEKGYSYSPRGSLVHSAGGSRLIVAADVATEVTAAALVEMRYELSRMVAGALDGDELERARRYRTGTLALAAQSQTGLTALLTTIAADGLTPEFLRSHPAALGKVTTADALDAAQRWLALHRLVTVMVGDAAEIVPRLQPLDDVEVIGA